MKEKFSLGQVAATPAALKEASGGLLISAYKTLKGANSSS